MVLTMITKQLLKEIETHTNLVWGWIGIKPTEFDQFDGYPKLIGVRSNRLKWFCTSRMNELLTRKGYKIVSNDEFLKKIKSEYVKK